MRTITHGLLFIALLTWTARAADGLLNTGDVRLTLTGACARGDREAADLHLDLTLDQGTWGDDVWGYAMTYGPLGRHVRSFGKGDHDGRLEDVREADGATRLAIAMDFKGGGWSSAGMKTVAEGRYVLRVRRTGNEFTGDFTGVFGDARVAGKVAGRIGPPMCRAVAGHEPLAPGEHPRLIFRKRSLPEIRRRATETPEGRAIVSQLKKRLAEPLKWGPRVPPRVAAGHGVLYALTDDKTHAARARAIVEQMMNGKGSDPKMIRRAPRAMGVALAYDLCYNGWDEAFRRKVTNWLEQAALDIFNGGKSGGLNEHPFSNWMGIAYSSAGTIAIAILGDPGDYPPRPVAPVMAQLMPPKDFTPGKGVPVVAYPDGVMPTQWLMAGPFSPRSDGDFLGSIGGRDKAHPEPGTEVTFNGGSCRFRPLAEDGIWVHKHFTFDKPALDLLVPIDRAYHTTSYYYNVLDNRRGGWFRIETDTRAGGRNAMLWIAGQRLGHSDLVRLSKGLYPVMLQASVGATESWGRILAAPRLTTVNDEQARAEHAARVAAHAPRSAAWEAGRTRYLSSDKTVPTAGYCYRRAVRGVRRFMDVHVGDHGFGLEGEGYLRFTLTCGFLQFLHANHVAMGREFVEGTGRDWLLLLPVITGVGPEGLRPTYGPAGWSNVGQQEERSGAFVTGFSTVPPDRRPAVKWWFDRTFGAKGNGTFNVFLPDQAGYALVNYPFGVKEANPATLLPRVVLDRHHGYFAARAQWKDADDLLTVLNLKSSVRSYVHQANPAASVRIMGFGGLAAEIGKVFVPGNTRFLGGLGGTVTHFKGAHDGTSAVAADLSMAYLRDAGKGKMPTDAGVRALRALAVDYSGRSGAPGLYVIVDRIRGSEMHEMNAWRLAAKGKLSARHNTFTVTSSGGRLTGRIIAPAVTSAAARRGYIEVTGGEDYFVVLTLTRRSAPAIEVTGSGLDATVRVGQRSVRFDGERIILGE